MTADSGGPLAHRVAERVRSEEPWDVFAERLRRYELHFNGPTIETIRGPLVVEGYGVRVFRTKGDVTGSGLQATTDASPEGIAQALEEAGRIAGYSTFPTKRVDLPSRSPKSKGGPEVLDRKLWDAPLDRLNEFMAGLLAPFESLKDVVPSFGSVRATLAETSLANSAGLRTQYAHTTVSLEIALKAFGGPEGAPAGEYWVNDQVRRVDPAKAGEKVPEWARFAQDARRAKAPPTGDIPVVLPAEVLASIIPPVVAFRFSGAARLRKIAPTPGDKLASPLVTLRDDGTVPWAPNSAPIDDEGTPTGAHPLVERGAATELIYDILHASAFDVPPSGNGMRGVTFGVRDWMRFCTEAMLSPTTIDLAPGDAGSDEELAEAAGDGIWVQQLGWAVPDPISGAFGGELRIGYRIKHGKLGEPLRGGTVGGTVLAPPGAPSLLADAAGLGSHATLNDSFRGPALLVRPLTVAGA
jgi:TldD protein